MGVDLAAPLKGTRPVVPDSRANETITTVVPLSQVKRTFLSLPEVLQTYECLVAAPVAVLPPEIIFLRGKFQTLRRYSLDDC